MCCDLRSGNEEEQSLCDSCSCVFGDRFFVAYLTCLPGRVD